ncbi:MAG: hypothetical protein ACI9W6_001856, partial [Motiliproteus sp.]
MINAVLDAVHKLRARYNSVSMSLWEPTSRF